MDAATRRKTQPLDVLICPGIARLTILSGNAPVGKSYVLSGDQLTIGGLDDDVNFADDPMVRPNHATIVHLDGNYTVRAGDTSNGVFIRIQEARRIRLPATLRVGAQTLHVVAADDSKPFIWQDGTRFQTSPSRQGSFSVHQIFEKGRAGAAALATEGRVLIGTAGAQLDLSHDAGISNEHAVVFEDQGAVWVEDRDSTNGTYVRVEGEVPLDHGDLLWIGQQLLRFDLT